MKLALDALQELPEGTIHTIPIRLDDCDVPDQFQRYHWANLFDPNWFDHIVNAIGVELAKGPKPASQPILQSTPRTSRLETPTTAATALEPTYDWVVEFNIPGEKYSARIVVAKLVKIIGGPVIFLTLFYPEQEPTPLLRVEGFSLEVDAIDFDA